MIEPSAKDFIERVIEINRVTRVVKGGKRLRFRALVIVGNHRGQVGLGIGKASDVSQSIRKALDKAYGSLQLVHLTAEGSLPYQVIGRFKKAHVLLKPAPPGTGVIAGGAVRTILELVGLKNVVSKALGSSDKLSNAQATLKAFKQIVDPRELLARRNRQATKEPVPAKIRVEKASRKRASAPTQK